MKLSEEQANELYELTKFISENEHDCFWVECKDGLYRPAANMNDFFWWACADCEVIYGNDLPDIEKARQDIADATGHDNFLIDLWHLELWCCRKRKERPQGACYPKAKSYGDKKHNFDALRKLFDECGPEKEVGVGNPYSRPTAEDDEKKMRAHWEELHATNPDCWKEY